MSGRYQFIDSGLYTLQQTISGTGVFDGTLLGYANYLYNSGGVSFKVRYPILGTEGNDYKFQMLVSPNAAITKTVAQYDPFIKTLTVYLKGTPGSITATAQEVCDAISALNGRNNINFGAAVVTGGTIPAALAAQSLAGGLDPDVTAGNAFPKLTAAANANGGLFYFDQGHPWKVQMVGGTFTANTTVTISVVNVTRALTISGPRMYLGTPQALTTPWILTSTRLDVPIMPGQALLVEANKPGTVFVSAAALSAMDNISD